MKFFIVLFCVIALSAAAKNRDNEHKEGHKPYKQSLSDKEHHEDDDELHDPNFDHEAFLGKEESETFDHMSPEESIQRLGKIVNKLDKDGDKKVTREELKAWIMTISLNASRKAAKEQFDSVSEDKKLLTWEAHLNSSYGSSETEKMDPHFKQSIANDERRWKLADQDGDGALSLEEFTAFIHPEEAPHMRDIVIQEAMGEMDKDKDGYVSLKEFIQDQHSPEEGKAEEEPKHVTEERKMFKEKYDKNGDGRLDAEEVVMWLTPQMSTISDDEAKHLISKADANNDGVLTKEEILNNHDLFAGSQATDYGNALNIHEEL